MHTVHSRPSGGKFQVTLVHDFHHYSDFHTPFSQPFFASLSLQAEEQRSKILFSPQRVSATTHLHWNVNTTTEKLEGSINPRKEKKWSLTHKMTSCKIFLSDIYLYFCTALDSLEIVLILRGSTPVFFNNHNSYRKSWNPMIDLWSILMQMVPYLGCCGKENFTRAF